jgi:ABC-2 type transport system ATP-binding protein
MVSAPEPPAITPLVGEPIAGEPIAGEPIEPIPGSSLEPQQAVVPVLEAHAARITVDDVVAVDALTITSRGARVLFVGDATALFAVLTGVPLAARVGAHDPGVPAGDARVVAGTLLVAGRDVARGAHVAIVGSAPLDPPLPVAWTVDQYVTWSARLAGAPPPLAKQLAGSALAKVGLGTSRDRMVRVLALPERRALLLASAVVMSPTVIIAEAPLAGLEGTAAAFVMNAVARVTEGRASILSATRFDPGTAEGALARAATDVLVVSGGAVILDGSAAEVFAGARIYTLTVRTNPEPLRAELLARGIELRGGPLRFSAALPPGASTHEILAAAAAARASIVELIPLLG